MVAGRGVRRLAEDADWLSAAIERVNFPSAEGVQLIYAVENGFYAAFAAVLDNEGGHVEHAGDGALRIDAGTVHGAGGHIADRQVVVHDSP